LAPSVDCWGISEATRRISEEALVRVKLGEGTEQRDGLPHNPPHPPPRKLVAHAHYLGFTMELTQYSVLTNQQLVDLVDERVAFAPVDMDRTVLAIRAMARILDGSDGDLSHDVRMLLIGQLLLLEEVVCDIDDPKTLEPRLDQMDVVWGNRTFAGRSLVVLIERLQSLGAQSHRERQAMVGVEENQRNIQ